MKTPFVDVFSGCGGFSEGFAGYKGGARTFDLVLAIDSDEAAHETHRLRSFFHEFDETPPEYYDYLRQAISSEDLYGLYPDQAASASHKIVNWELGKCAEVDQQVHTEISKRIDGTSDWVLIGGPPCQAYSIAGRSRNKGIEGYEPEQDSRHFLYREYLKILADHWPAVFVMENVPGILNSKVAGEKIWHRILEDLVDPSVALGTNDAVAQYDGYRLYSLVSTDRGVDIFGIPTLNPGEYVVQCEKFGIPQARHRVFIVGVRSDLEAQPRQLRPLGSAVTVGSVIDDLPPLRSGLTRIEDRDSNWKAVMEDFVNADWWKDYNGVGTEVVSELANVESPARGRGGQFVKATRSKRSALPKHLRDWLLDKRIRGTCNHESKAHMESDIHRYAFAASFAGLAQEKLRLIHFPKALRPEHENIRNATDAELSHSNFADRFSVQSKDEPARTVVSHISKDGHYYIHPDPMQARSLTVREAARLQTFPDNFFFPGARTEQYRQVGNAVPPFLALQIADIVDDVLTRSR